jgi:hypothetical protein
MSLAARFKGIINATRSSTLQLRLVALGGVRITVAGSTLFNQWNAASPVRNSTAVGAVSVVAFQPLEIVVEYYSSLGTPHLELFVLPSTGGDEMYLSFPDVNVTAAGQSLSLSLSHTDCCLWSL